MAQYAARTHGETLGEVTHVIDRAVADVAHGRFERSLSGLTAFAAAVTTAEIYIEHYKASFGNKWMWSPIIVTPPVVVAGVAGVFSKRWAKTALPVTAARLHRQRPGGRVLPRPRRGPQTRRLVSWPRTTCPWVRRSRRPGLMTIVGGMGLLAALLRRED